MFAEEIRRAMLATPRVRLAELSAAVWKGFACGAVSEEDAQQLADEIHARKAIPPTPAAPRKPVGSRPRVAGAHGPAAAAGRAPAGFRRSSRPCSRWPRRPCCR